MNTKKQKLSISDKIKRFSSEVIVFVTPNASYSGDNYKNIPLVVAIFISLISIAILAGFVFVAVVILTSN